MIFFYSKCANRSDYQCRRGLTIHGTRTTCFDSFRHLEFSPSAPHIARIYSLLSASVSITGNFRGHLELEAAWDLYQETKLSYFPKDFDWF